MSLIDVRKSAEQVEARLNNSKGKRHPGQNFTWIIENNFFLIRTPFFLAQAGYEFEIATNQLTTIFQVFQRFQPGCSKNELAEKEWSFE